MRRVAILAALAALLAGCPSGQSPAYSTKHGIQVFTEPLNAPEKESVEQWSAQAVGFWRRIYPTDESCFWASVSLTNARFVNLDHVSDVDGEIFAGLEYGYDIWISNGTRAKVRGVFIHELSHVLAGVCLGLPGNDESHGEFERRNLKGFTKY